MITDPVILLSGGKGSRMTTFQKDKNEPPKALILINSIPLILHSIKNFIDYDYRNFIFALGYKGEMIRDYFTKKKKIFGYNFNLLTSFKEFNAKSQIDDKHINLLLVNTGVNSNKLQRIYKIISKLNVNNFVATYADGVGNLNLSKMRNKHINNNYLCTCASFTPHSQYGHFIYSNKKVIDIIEKPLLNNEVNIGYFFFKASSMNYIKKNLNKDLEIGLLKKLAHNSEIQTYSHKGFWKSIDTLKDAFELSKILKK